MHRTLAFLLLFVATPARANCAESYAELADVAPYAAAGLATLKAGPDGACFDRVEGDRLYTTAAFERVPAARKQAVLEAGYTALWQAIPPAERERRRDDNGVVASPIRVVDPLGRTLYRDTPCAGAYATLTEHQRDTAQFAIGYSPTALERPRAHALKLDLKRVKQAFHGVMSWKPAYYIAWVPEAGCFELDLPDQAAVARLSRYWPKAPRGYRYDVRLNDGTLVQTVQR